jgi:hypothetical protein
MIGANTDKKHKNYKPDPNNFFNLVAQNLGIEFECHAKNGASNEHIIRKVEEWITKSSEPNDQKFVFVGWSTWERQEQKINNVYYDIDAWSIYHAWDHPPELDIIANKLKEQVAQDSDYMRNCARNWTVRIRDWAMSLQARGIRYFFWNAYMPLEHPATHDMIDFDHRYVLPYDNNFNMFFYLKKVRNFSTQLNDPYHYDTLAHKAWADFLTQYIKDWQILPQPEKLL